MTLNDIIVGALMNLDLGHDQQTLEQWRSKLTLFANDAVYDLAATFKLKRTEEVAITQNGIDLSQLERTCIKIIELTVNGNAIGGNTALNSAALSVGATASLTYQYMPKSLTRPSDVPDIPFFLHPLIIDYVVARQRMSGDTSTQSGGNIYMQIYINSRNNLVRSSRGSTCFKNKFVG